VRDLRAILAEVHVLISCSQFWTFKLMAVGFDYNQLCIILSVLEKRASLYFSSSDVYVNLVGGSSLMIRYLTLAEDIFTPLHNHFKKYFHIKKL
jgi:predicted ATP-dependent serine protease